MKPAPILAIMLVGLNTMGCEKESTSTEVPISSFYDKKTPGITNHPCASTTSSADNNVRKNNARILTVAIDNDLPVYLLRGKGKHKMVFLHGYCSHALAYIKSFAGAVLTYGTMIGIQANKPCKENDSYYWTNTPDELNRRIEAAFHAVGVPAPIEDIAIVGYSSGAVLAEMLAHKYPKRFSHVVLIGGPQKPVEWRLRYTRSTVMIAGQRDRQDLMQEGARDLSAAGIPSTFLMLPGAKHGQMGPESELVMKQALQWLWDNERVVP